MSSHKLIDTYPKYDFDDVMMVPKSASRITSRKEVNLAVTIGFEHRMNVVTNEYQRITCIPIVASNMDKIGTTQMYKALSPYQMITCFTKHVTLEKLVRDIPKEEFNPDYYILSSGIRDTEIEQLEEKIKGIEEHYNHRPKMICFDVANGYMEMFLNCVKSFRERHPDFIIIAGNVVHSSILSQMKEIGVDIVKVGIGSGSVCTTRVKAGVGYPQCSAIMDMYKMAKHYGIYIMSDGGIKTPGDVCKAFGAGSDFVMIGGMFAGHDECLTEEERNLKIQEIDFYGSSSEVALDKYYGGTQRYRANEGRVVKVQRKGPIRDTIEDLLGGVRSSCSYLNSMNVIELKQKAYFIIVQHQTSNLFHPSR
jgi:GMP reductase